MPGLVLIDRRQKRLRIPRVPRGRRREVGDVGHLQFPCETEDILGRAAPAVHHDHGQPRTVDGYSLLQDGLMGVWIVHR